MRRHLAASALVALGFTYACATGSQLDPEETSLAQQACEAQCDCLRCTNAQLDKCESDIDLLSDQAEDANCSDELDAYLGCISDDSECKSAQLDTAICAQKSAIYSACMESAPPSCASVANGICDEPEGTGLCPEGTDIADCVGNGSCPSVNDGICDQPEGTGKCPPLSDIADCAGGTCTSTYDGVCDEPEGTGICPEGSDSYDCTPASDCIYPNDGICDEPEGTGVCAEGTDPLDCGSSGSCSTCYEYGYEASALPLCAASAPLWDAVSNCICSYGCPTECASVCGGGATDSYCDSCMSTYCSTELDACYNDL